MRPTTLFVDGNAYRIGVDNESGNGWLGVVLTDAPGCVAMGPTLEAALRNAKSAVRDWLEPKTEPPKRAIAAAPTVSSHTGWIAT